MTADDIIGCGPDNAREGMEYGLKRAGLPTEPSKIMGRTFRFMSKVSPHGVIVVGQVGKLLIEKGEISIIPTTRLDDMFLQWSETGWKMSRLVYGHHRAQHGQLEILND
jgi:hypothetical protein